MKSFILESQAPSKVCEHWRGSSRYMIFYCPFPSRRFKATPSAQPPVPISTPFATQNFPRHPGLGRGESTRRSRRMNESIFSQDWGKITSIKTRAPRRATVGLRNLFCIILSANFPVSFPKVPFIEDVRVFPLTKDLNNNVIKFRMTFPPFLRMLWELKAFWDELGRSWKYFTFIQLRFSGQFLGEFIGLLSRSFYVGSYSEDLLFREILSFISIDISIKFNDSEIR